ncbi:MAG: hypothetical protein R3C03_11925 [Pirellulaceae bacterium]
MVNQTGGVSLKNLNAYQWAFAGNGGIGLIGAGGDGGHTFSYLSTSRFAVADTADGLFTLNLKAIGGNGGEGRVAAYSAGNGGNARIGIDTITQGLQANVVAIATAGNGGNHLAGGKAGNGGAATLSNTTIDTTIQTVLSFEAEFRGGNGGDSSGVTQMGYGNGGSVTSLNQLHFVGNNGVGRANVRLEGFGGNAGGFEDIDNANPNVASAGDVLFRHSDSTPLEHKTIWFYGYAGEGASLIKPNEPILPEDWAGGNGGDSDVQVFSRNAGGDLNVRIISQAGDVGGGGASLLGNSGPIGFGGNAISVADGRAFGIDSDVSVYSGAQSGRGVETLNFQGGGSAISKAIAFGNCYSVKTEADAESVNSSNTTYALANSTNLSANPIGITRSNSHALGRPESNVLDILGSSVLSHANTNTASHGEAEAVSIAGNSGQAISRAIGKGGSVDSLAQATGGDGVWSTNGFRSGNAYALSKAELSDIANNGGRLYAKSEAYGGNCDSPEDVWGIGGNAKAVAISDDSNPGDRFDAMTSSWAYSTAGAGQSSSTRSGRDGFATAISKSISHSDHDYSAALSTANST